MGIKRILFAAALLAPLTVSSNSAATVSGTILAAPVPCEIYLTENTCTSVIFWSSSRTTSVQVWVSLNGAPETLFATSASGPSQQFATWLQSGTSQVGVSVYSYVFSLYNYSPQGNRGPLLSSTTVTGGTQRPLPTPILV